MSSQAIARTARKTAGIGKLNPGTTSFFLCDIQERFRPLIYNSETIISTAKYMTSIADTLAIPIIVTQQYTKVFGPTISDCFENGSVKLNDLVEQGRVFEKKKFSMVTSEVQDCLLNTSDFSDRKSVVLFGIEAHVCVQQTCLDLLEVSTTRVLV
jgi:nicotinamidase-related amidase